MSLEKIVAEAMEGNPLTVKELFEEEMKRRVAEALEETYKRKMRAEGDDEDEDDDDDDDDDDEDEDSEKKNENLEESLQILAESAEAVAAHSRILDDHHDAHYEKEGYHAHGHPDHLNNLRHAHNTIANIHDAHRTLHTHAGNFDAAEDHEDAARMHRECADMSHSRPKRVKHGMYSSGAQYELESHEEYCQHQTHAQSASSDAFKHKLPKH